MNPPKSKIKSQKKNKSKKKESRVKPKTFEVKFEIPSSCQPSCSKTTDFQLSREKSKSLDAAQSKKVERLNKAVAKLNIDAAKREEAKKRTKTKVKSLLEEAADVVIKSTDVLLLLKVLQEASDLALKHFAPDHTLEILQQCSKILDGFFVDLEFVNEFGDAVFQDAVTKIEELGRMTANLKGVNKPKCAKVCVTYYLCFCGLNEHAKRYEDLNLKADEALELLNKHFRLNLDKMYEFGQACCYKGLYFSEKEQHQKSDSYYRKGLNALFNINTMESDKTTAGSLYNSVASIYKQDRSLLEGNFGNKFLSRMLDRSRSSLSQYENLLCLLSLILLSDAVGNREVCVAKINRLDEINLDFIPPCEVVTATLNLMFSIFSRGLIPKDLEFRYKFFIFAKDLSLSNQKESKKFYQLNFVIWAAVFLEGNFPESQDFYLWLIQIFDAELWDLELSSSCAWMHRRLISASLILSYYYAVTDQMKDCIRKAEEVFSIVSTYDGPQDRQIDVTVAETHYLLGVVFFKLGDNHEAKVYIQNQVVTLKAIYPPFGDRCRNAESYLCFLNYVIRFHPRFHDTPHGLAYLFGDHNPALEC